jgi:multiple antibiotic resistance protein
MLGKLFRDFTFIWTTVDPIGNLALFAGLTAALTREERRRVARRATTYAAIILIGAVALGQIILDAMGVHLLSLKLAGGIILFLFSLQMLFGSMDSTDGKVEAGRDIAIFPLAVPSIAGPGTIMAVIVQTDNDVYTIPEQAATAGVLLLVLLITHGFFLASDAILRVIGLQGASILVRVMGLLLAALSVELVMNALSIPPWAVLGGKH